MKALILPSATEIGALRVPAEAAHVASMADAAIRYAKRAKHGLEQVNAVAELKLRAERQAGKLLGALRRAPGGRSGNPPSEYRQALHAARVEARTARRWQRMAGVSDEEFDRIIAAALGAQTELTTERVLVAMREKKTAPRPGARVAPGGKPIYQDEWVTLYCGDSTKILRSLKGTPDHIITDPPYARHCDVNQPGKMGKLRDGIERVRNLGFDELSEELIASIAPQLARVRRWCLVYSDVESTHLWRNALVAAGMRYVRTGAWVRLGTTPQFSGDRPGVGFEAVTICHGSGNRQMHWNAGGKPALWSFPIAQRSDGGRPHTTPKPLSLIAEQVEQFTQEGDMIWDPFAGSGTTLVAARQQRRHALGIELCPEFCQIAIDRLTQIQTA